MLHFVKLIKKGLLNRFGLSIYTIDNVRINLYNITTIPSLSAKTTTGGQKWNFIL